MPATERRVVSVVFADLVGFTTLSEGRDAEEVRDLLSRYFEVSRQLVRRYGGTVEKFIGDAVMAVWGTPVATEDDAERAVRAALDLTQAVASLGAEVGHPDLRARAGVLTGEAAVNVGAVGEGMVAGDLVNTASRIQSAAPPGAVFVGEATRRATEPTVVYEDAGAFELKGKSGLVPLWRALRVVAGARGALKSAGLEAPFVGRARELRMVKDLFHASAEEKRAHLVSVLGIAGIGKSRLGWEFYKYMDGLHDVYAWHRGRCLAYGEGVTYWALAEMVKMRARIAEEEESGSALAKLRATIEQYVTDPEERRWVEPRLGHLLGLEERTAVDREDLFASWRLFFERVAQAGPVVMVFEDMQWADTSLLDFIEYLMDWSRNFPLFVMTLARPELSERRASWGVGKRNFTAMYLDPLPPEAMEELITGLVPGLPQELRRRILERAEGVPLYAMETVRMLLDRGLLILEGSAYRPNGPVDALEVPETLQALIAARLDGLTSDERGFVQDASVLGKTFTKSGLAALTGMSEPELEPLLSSLVRKELLSIQADPRSPERGQYGFLQDLVKKVAYETLSKKERKARHLSAAAHLEATWGADEEEIVEVVASHYLQAYDAAPDSDDAPGIRARARDMLSRAGDRAASLAASDEAQRYFEQAISLATEPLERADLHERAGQMAWMGGHAEPAEEHLDRAAALFGSEGATHRAARVSARLAEVDWNRGRAQEAVARLEPAFEVLSKEQPDEDLATVCAQFGRFLGLTGHLQQASERLEQALELAELLRLPEVFSQALSSKAILLFRSSRLDEARILLHGALEVALDNDLGAAALRAYNNLIYAMECGDRYEEALETCDRAIEVARRVGDRLGEWAFMTGGISLLVVVGRWHQASAWASEVLTNIEGDRIDFVQVGLLDLVEVYVHQGKLAEAQSLLSTFSRMAGTEEWQTRASYAVSRAQMLSGAGRHREALAAAEDALSGRFELGPTDNRVKRSLVMAVEAALALGDLPKAEEILAMVDGLAPGEVAPSVRAHVQRFRARVAADKGQGDAVEPGFKAAAGTFRELGAPFWLAITLLEHAEWLGSADRADEGGPFLAEAREIFERLEAAPWLERLAAAQGRVGTLVDG